MPQETDVLCYEREGKEQQTSQYPGPDEKHVQWFHGFLPGQQVALDHPPHTGMVPPRMCQLDCHHRGRCVVYEGQTTPLCECLLGYTGPACEITLPEMCIRNCSNRGTCSRGFCHCHPGYFGLDCGRSKAFSGNAGSVKSVSKLKIYAYELPSHIVDPYKPLWLSSHYTAFEQFMQSFYGDWGVRTENPHEANLYYVPALTYYYSSNLEDPVNHIRSVVDHIRTRYPFWNITSGRDHILWVPTDRGACWPSPLDKDLDHFIRIVHFGYAGHDKRITKGQLKRWYSCFNPLRDIVAPPYWAHQGEVANATFQSFDPDLVPPKLLFFSGSVRQSSPEYSGGVRQALYEMYGQHQDPDVDFLEGNQVDYQAVMKSYKFCLAPYGHGWGIRLSEVVLHGCVPVIIQDHVYQYYHDLLPYHEFSVVLPKAVVPQLAKMLRSIDTETYRGLRRGLMKHYRAFLWNEGGAAYDYLVDSLRSRWMNLMGRHFRRLKGM